MKKKSIRVGGHYWILWGIIWLAVLFTLVWFISVMNYDYPNDECESENPDYVWEYVCVEVFQHKQFNVSYEGINLTIDLSTTNENMYVCSEYEKICRKRFN